MVCCSVLPMCLLRRRGVSFAFCLKGCYGCGRVRVTLLLSVIARFETGKFWMCSDSFAWHLCKREATAAISPHTPHAGHPERVEGYHRSTLVFSSFFTCCYGFSVGKCGNLRKIETFAFQERHQKIANSQSHHRRAHDGTDIDDRARYSARTVRVLHLPGGVSR